MHARLGLVEVRSRAAGLKQTPQPDDWYSREGGALRKPASLLLVVRRGTLESVDLVALSPREPDPLAREGADAAEPSPCCIAEGGVGTSDS
jgi:hypothetical protein